VSVHGRHHLGSGLRWYLIIFDPQTFVLDHRKGTCRLLSLLVSCIGSTDFTPTPRIWSTPIPPIDHCLAAPYQYTTWPCCIILCCRFQARFEPGLLGALTFPQSKTVKGPPPSGAEPPGRSPVSAFKAREGFCPHHYRRLHEGFSAQDGRARLDAPPSHMPGLVGPHGATFSDYERFNCNNLNRCYRSWNYRGCWHQTCPPIATRWGV